MNAFIPYHFLTVVFQLQAAGNQYISDVAFLTDMHFRISRPRDHPYDHTILICSQITGSVFLLLHCICKNPLFDCNHKTCSFYSGRHPGNVIIVFPDCRSNGTAADLTPLYPMHNAFLFKKIQDLLCTVPCISRHVNFPDTPRQAK